MGWGLLYFVDDDSSGVLGGRAGWVQIFQWLVKFFDPLQASEMTDHTLRCLLHFRGIHAWCVIRLPRCVFFNISIEDCHLAIAYHLVIRAFFRTVGCRWIESLDLTLAHVRLMLSQQPIRKVNSFALLLDLEVIVIVIVDDRSRRSRLNHDISSCCLSISGNVLTLIAQKLRLTDRHYGLSPDPTIALITAWVPFGPVSSAPSLSTIAIAARLCAACLAGLSLAYRLELYVVHHVGGTCVVGATTLPATMVALSTHLSVLVAIVGALAADHLKRFVVMRWVSAMVPLWLRAVTSIRAGFPAVSCGVDHCLVLVMLSQKVERGVRCTRFHQSWGDCFLCSTALDRCSHLFLLQGCHLCSRLALLDLAVAQFLILFGRSGCIRLCHELGQSLIALASWVFQRGSCRRLVRCHSLWSCLLEARRWKVRNWGRCHFFLTTSACPIIAINFTCAFARGFRRRLRILIISFTSARCRPHRCRSLTPYI